MDCNGVQTFLADHQTIYYGSVAAVVSLVENSE